MYIIYQSIRNSHNSHNESALLLSAGLYDVLALLLTGFTTTLHLALASGYLHYIVQPANLLTQQRLGSESGSLQLTVS